MAGLTLWTLKFGKGRGYGSGLLLVVLLGGLSLLIHEAQLLMFWPMVLLWLVLDCPEVAMRKRRACLAVMVWGGLALFAVWITEFGVITTMSHEAYVGTLGQSGSPVNSLAAEIPFRDVSKNLGYTLGLTFRSTVLPHHLFIFLGALPLGVVLAKLFCRLRDEVPEFPLYLMACCAPLSLYAVGLDHFRWWALALTNVFLLFSWLAAQPRVRVCLLDACVANRKWIVAAVLMSLLLGSTADTGSYAGVEALVRYLRVNTLSK
ncbi:MAG: hypothetical protein JJU29_13030 [Verrucomicrobia bacterium]|nr:hypothetical protein [Verrucomicrobiota bacterium]MCC5849003.1 hypothetical protein [Verrucomicrobiota bacterium]